MSQRKHVVAIENAYCETSDVTTVPDHCFINKKHGFPHFSTRECEINCNYQDLRNYDLCSSRNVDMNELVFSMDRDQGRKSFDIQEEKKDENNNDDGGGENQDELERRLSRIWERVEQLKTHPKYLMMKDKHFALSDDELFSVIYYTDLDSACRKMKKAHRNVLPESIRQEKEKWKELYFHLTNAVMKMHTVFHAGKDKQAFTRLYHGSPVYLDPLSQEQVFFKTVWSWSISFQVAKS